MKYLKAVVLGLGLFTLGLGHSAKVLAAYGNNDSTQYAPIPELEYHNPDDDVSIFDEMRLHLGIGLINTFQDLPIAKGVRKQADARGVNLNFGVDMFSPHWIVQGVLVNIPEASSGDVRFSSNGFELRALYDTAILEGVTVHGGLGIASRGYNIKTSARSDGSVQAGENSFQSGATVIAAGIDYWVSPSVSFGGELMDHLPMASGDEPSSIDFSVGINGHF